MMRKMSSALLVCAAAFVAVTCSWGNQTGTPEPDAARNSHVCGDGICDSTEVNNCPVDCGGNSNPPCNHNGVCDPGEMAATCSDCMTGSGSGSGSGSGGMCPTDPTMCIGCIITPTTCPPGLDANACLACLLGGGMGSGSGGMGCVGGFPNGTCDPGEDNMSCPFDCP